MKTKHIAMLALAMAAGTSALSAQENPLWMRYCAISPDGNTIAFAYKGDLFTVPTNGGQATQITSNAGFDSYPVWSPDGQHIAFASDRMGSLDIYVTSSKGGTPKRVTTHSGKETPIAFKDNKTILFAASQMQDAKDIQFPTSSFHQVYEVSIDGGRPKMFSSYTMESMSLNPKDASQWLYQDKKGYEDQWRKHERASISRDIWLMTDKGERSFKKLTTFDGEDRNPVWAPDGKSFYYLSEQNGSFNVFSRTLDNAQAKQITHHTTHPVRFLTVANDGTLCYGWNGEIYTLGKNGKSSKVKINVSADNESRELIKQTLSSGATEISPSPDGKEVAFILHGDVYVTSTEYSTTRRITNTPQQERNVHFSPDGRSIVYASERDGVWQIYQSSLVDKEDKMFTYATNIKEERLTKTNLTSFEPQYSPDGKEVAFLQERTAICVINLKTRNVRTVMDKKYQYSYSDGDQWFQWSPDSKWILSDYIGIGGWNNKDVVLLNADGKGEMHNLTQSGYTDSNARWVLGGKAMVWESDRAGYRSHGSWGAESDAYIMFFDVEAYDRFCMNKEDLAIKEEAEKEEKDKEKKAEDAKKKKDGKDSKDKKADDKKKDEEVKPLKFDLENCRDRVRRLTVNSSRLSDCYLNPKGDKFYYQAAFEKGYDLWVHDLKDNSTRILVKGAGGSLMNPDKKGENLYLCGNSLKKISLKDGKTTNIDFKAQFDFRPMEERAYIFDHAWRQVKDKFYKADLHGTDWEGMKKNYERFLPYISNKYDFAEMLSEMLGELNASHTGCRYNHYNTAPATANLGVFFDNSYEGDGLKIQEIIAKSPLSLKKTDVKAGCIIEQIDGTPIRKDEDYFPLLEGKVGEKIRLTVYDPTTKKRFDETIKGLGGINGLLYNRWVEHNAKEVERMSNGRVGYVHIQAMDGNSFHKLYSELLGRYRHTDAVIVDTRHNGGGWLHDDVVTLLGGKEYEQFVSRGQYIGSDPFNKWLKPSCMLICEDNYSNACGTPWVYKELGIGKLVGAPIPGTMTAVWWESQIDPSLVFGIPQVGCRDMRGNYSENSQVEPDIAVYNTPEEQLKGIDRQLEKAVQLMLETIKKK